ncbi:MAG: hypothetical protein ACO1RA_10455 [Planctomycetaceae bacterium]
MNTKTFFLMSALLFASGASLFADDRTWTDVKGRKIEAEFLREEGSYVVLAQGDKVMRIAKASLCEEDQNYLKSLREKNDIAPPKETPVEENPFGEAASPGSLSKPEGMDSPAETPAPSTSKTKTKDSSAPVQVGLGEMRLWAMMDGSTVRAKFVQVKENMVILRTGIKNQTVLFVALSAPDQEYVKGMLRGRKQDAMIPYLEREVELAKNGRNGGTGTLANAPSSPITGSSPSGIGSSSIGSMPSGLSPIGSSPFGPPGSSYGSRSSLPTTPGGDLGSRSTGVVSPDPFSPTYSGISSPPGYGSGSSVPAPNYGSVPSSYGSGNPTSVPAPTYSSSSPPVHPEEAYKSSSGLYEKKPNAGRNLLLELGVTGYMLAGSFAALCIALVATVLKIAVSGKA